MLDIQEIYREHPSEMRSLVRNDTTMYPVAVAAEDYMERSVKRGPPGACNNSIHVNEMQIIKTLIPK